MRGDEPMSGGAITQMGREIAEIPDVVARQADEGLGAYREEGERLRAARPRFFITCARGTSDHAATYFKHLAETRLGVPVASVGPSAASVYNAPLKLEGAVCLTISQSGASPDIAMLQARARLGGARTVALLNEVDSPAGEGADCALPVLAGPERAVAATKSHVASLVALSAVFAALAGDKAVSDAIRRLPDALSAALSRDWSEALAPLSAASSLFTISRGPGLALAGEAALKFKETCRLHAEAHSGAEVRHGPIALARSRFAALVFATEDESGASILDAANSMSQAGADVFVAGAEFGRNQLPTAKAPHPLLAPVCQAVSFYRFAEALARWMGVNPDDPPNIKKVTRTV